MSYRNENPYDLTGLDLSGRILELGPGNGQLEAPVLAAGGEWVGVDKDPRSPSIRLDYGAYPHKLPLGLFDGVYTRSSIGVEWKKLPELAENIHYRMKVDAWGWLALWHGFKSPKSSLDRATAVFEQYGWQSVPNDGLSQDVLVVKGLDVWPPLIANSQLIPAFPKEV